ncbi:hypothetical protein Bhyg_11980, partial [Pseudolycoriella hygida]
MSDSSNNDVSNEEALKAVQAVEESQTPKIIRVLTSTRMEKIELKIHKPKPTRMASIEEAIQLARIQQVASTSALYERNHNQKALKVVTVAAYILFVSMAAITLSFYYVFIWDPTTKTVPQRSSNNCDNKIVIPESIAIRLANSSEVTAENFFKHFLKLYQTQKNDDPLTESREVKTVPLSAKQVLVDMLNPRLAKVYQTPSTKTTIGESIGESYETSTQATSTIIDISQNHNDDDTETDSETDYESSGQKNWNDTTILLDEDRNNV